MSDYSDNAQENPASKSDGKSLAVLFRTDPLELTKDDRAEIIKAMRKQRTEFIGQGSKPAKKKKAAKKQNLPDIDDLDIEI